MRTEIRSGNPDSRIVVLDVPVWQFYVAQIFTCLRIAAPIRTIDQRNGNDLGLRHHFGRELNILEEILNNEWCGYNHADCSDAKARVEQDSGADQPEY